MRRSAGARATAGLLAGVFLLAGAADVYGLHRCSHHDRTDPVADVAHAAAETAAPGRPVLAPASDPEDAGEHPSDGFCTCVGACHAGAASPTPGSGTASPVSGRVGTVALHGSGADAPRAARSEYLLPFANAPPLSALVA